MLSWLLIGDIMTLRNCLQCPACGFTYSGKNPKVFGHFRAYVLKEFCRSTGEYKRFQLMLKCKKCSSMFTVTTSEARIALVSYKDK